MAYEVVALAEAEHGGGAEGDVKLLKGPAFGKPALGGDFTLINQDNKVTRNSDLHGAWALLYFGFTYCPDICPNELTRLQESGEGTAEDIERQQKRTVRASREQSEEVKQLLRLMGVPVLDAPWCADYGVVSGYNDDFPLRDHGGAFKGDEQVLPADGVPARGRPNRGRSAPVRDFNKNYVPVLNSFLEPLRLVRR